MIDLIQLILQNYYKSLIFSGLRVRVLLILVILVVIFIFFCLNKHYNNGCNWNTMECITSSTSNNSYLHFVSVACSNGNIACVINWQQFDYYRLMSFINKSYFRKNKTYFKISPKIKFSPPLSHLHPSCIKSINFHHSLYFLCNFKVQL